VVRDFLAPLSAVEPVRRPTQQRPPEPGLVRRNLRYVAIAVAAALLVAAIALIAHPRKSEKPTKHQTDTGIFSKTHGWITLGGQQIIALNPADPRQTRVLSGAQGDPLAWSRDGTQLLIARVHGLAVLHSDGHWSQLTPGTRVAAGSFTPDGSHVIYADSGSIWSVPSDGGQRHAIARGTGPPNGTVYTFPGWTGNQLSPDGRTLVYTPGWTTPQTLAIALMDSDGSNQRPLVSFQQVVTSMGVPHWQLSGTGDFFALAWLGDSSRVLILAAGDTRCAMFAVNADGSDLQRWGPRGRCPVRAAASPDGSHVALTVLIDHRRGMLITNDRGDITQTIRFPHNEAHPFPAWQP
jgi:Tol biopolymer transport system component